MTISPSTVTRPMRPCQTEAVAPETLLLSISIPAVNISVSDGHRHTTLGKTLHSAFPHTSLPASCTWTEDADILPLALGKEIQTPLPGTRSLTLFVKPFAHILPISAVASSLADDLSVRDSVKPKTSNTGITGILHGRCLGTEGNPIRMGPATLPSFHIPCIRDLIDPC